MDDRGWQTLVWAVAAVAAVLLALRMLGPTPPTPPVHVPRADAAADRRGGGSRRPGPYVHVAGAVRRPGVYRLPDGARVEDAVRRAGGADGAADLTAINLAAPLRDGQQVVVPAQAMDGGSAAAAAVAADAPVSLGSATVEQLEDLDGIGPTLAQRIVDDRQARGGFASLDELADVDGIGEQRLEALRQALTP
ncbi:MAG: ComEA family DNA-binding protein [Thermoleophilaceae bacterium]